MPTVPRLLPPVICAVALLITFVPTARAAVTVGLTGVDGNPSQIGPIHGHYLTLGQSTKRDVRKAEGRKPHSDLPVMGRTGIVGRQVEYRFRETKRRTCRHEYGFLTGHRLGDFESTCRATRTPRGAHVGMNVMQAEAKEGAAFVYSPALGHDCSFAAVGLPEMGSGGIWIVLWANSQNPDSGKTAKVRSIAAHNDDGVIWPAACM